MHKPRNKKAGPTTSWEPVQKWYKKIVNEEGHYYHQSIVLPGVLRLMNLKSVKNPAILDIACGQGILGRTLPPETRYTGLDISPSFIKEAAKLDPLPNHQYLVADATKPLPLKERLFSHTAIILAIQNIESPLAVFNNASHFLEKEGKLLLVLNHPCFRIPRQSSWQIEEEKKLQYRRIDRYMSPLQIPIQAHPSKGKESPATVSFHYPLSQYVQWLFEAGFMIEKMEEWCSDKTSTGSASKMENRAREEFPLFLAISAVKK